MQSEVPRRAALARVSSWLSGNERFLLVTGGMGSGKSVLTRQVLAELRTANIVHAEHFCQADNTSTIAVSALLRGWGDRLGQALPGFSEDLALDAGVHITGTASGPGSTGVRVGRIIVGDEPPADTFVRVIGEPLERLATAGRLPTVVLIVDGVEEARDADGRNRILTLLAGLTTTALPPGARILATSRPEHNVRIALESVAHLDLDAIGTEDVAEYIALRADRRFATRLSKHVQGNFLLASSILDDLAGPLTTAAIPALPSSLPAIFRKRLWRMVDEHDQHTLDVLGLLAIAREPLREPEIAALLGIERHRVRASINRILPMLAPEQQRHRLFHRALAEFLLNPDENPLPLRSADSLHRDIATRMYETWAGRWDRCDDEYTLHHLVAHLTMAPDARPTLSRLVFDPGFLQAKAATDGVDALHTDLQLAAATRLDRSLLRQAHHLRDWDPRANPGLFLQQLHHDATISGDNQLATVLSGQMDRHAHLRLRWWVNPESSGRPERTLVGHRGRITAHAITPDGTRVVTASEDRTARIWDLRTGRPIHVLTGHEAAVTCVAVAPDCARIVTGSEDGSARVWSIEAGKLLHCLTGSDDVITIVAFTPDGASVVAACGDRRLRVWSVHTGRMLETSMDHQGHIDSLALTPDGRAITASADGRGRIFDLETGRRVRMMSYNKAIIMAADLEPAHTQLVLAAGDTADVWDLRGDGRPRRDNDPIQGMVATADGQFLIVGLTGHTWMLVAQSGQYLGRLGAGSNLMSADESHVAIAGWGGEVLIWQLPSGQLRHALTGHEDNVTVIALTRSHVVTASWDTTVRVWDLDGRRLRHTLKGHDDWVNAVAATPDGARAISGSSDGTARVWNIHSGQEMLVLPHRCPIRTVAVTQDGTRVVTAAADGTARVWDLRSGELVRVLAGHEGAVNALALAGERAVTGSDDGTAVVWDLRHDEPEYTIEGHRGPVRTVAISADGSRVVTAAADTVRVWSPETTLCAGVSEAITCLAVHPGEPVVVTVGTERGRLFSYQVIDQGRRT